jgi:hypothetical protein
MVESSEYDVTIPMSTVGQTGIVMAHLFFCAGCEEFDKGMESLWLMLSYLLGVR